MEISFKAFLAAFAERAVKLAYSADGQAYDKKLRRLGGARKIFHSLLRRIYADDAYNGALFGTPAVAYAQA